LITFEIPKKYKIEAPHYRHATNLATHPPLNISFVVLTVQLSNVSAFFPAKTFLPEKLFLVPNYLFF
jgi:hypothetical protein